MPDNTNKVKGRVHPEDSWTDYGCGDCGDYADNNGCRGPRGKVDLSSIVITNKTTTNWVYQVVLDLEKLVSNHISLSNSYIGISFYGIPLTKLGNGPTTLSNICSKKTIAVKEITKSFSKGKELFDGKEKLNWTRNN